VGGAVLSSDLPVLRTYALLAIAPALVFVCVRGIGAVVGVSADEIVPSTPRELRT
jgi:hypothetical protein